MEKIRKKAIACLLAGAIGATSLGLVSCGGKADPDLLTSYSFEDTVGSTTFNAATGKYDKINYVFNAENAEYLVKQPSDPMTRVGVSGKSLYLDGFSTEIIDSDFEIPRGGGYFFGMGRAAYIRVYSRLRGEGFRVCGGSTALDFCNQ